MASIEQSIKSQFAKVFVASDWCLFKKIAESNLREAAGLLKRDMPIETSLRLLARNARKRLLIGIGVELLLKAVYLKQGYMINKPPSGSELKFPFSAQDAAEERLIPDQTFMLNDLVEKLPKILVMLDGKQTLKGLKIAKVFRNKEGHVITTAHIFDAANYTDIAASLSALYRDAFREKLSVRFAIAQKEKAVWRVSRPSKRL